MLVTLSEKDQEASNFLGQPPTQKRKSHTVGENLIMPMCNKITLSKMLGQDAIWENEKILSENNITSEWVNDVTWRWEVCILVEN